MTGLLKSNDSEDANDNDAGEDGNVKVSSSKCRNNVINLFKDFANNTTLHGFSNAIKPRHQFNRFRWKNLLFLVAIISCLSLTGRNLYILISDYLEYPVTTSIIVETNKELELPAITLANCNKLPTKDYFNYTIEAVSNCLSIFLSNYLHYDRFNIM